MADKHSFDITAKVDLQELDNAINQALREIKNRYDLKESGSLIEFKTNENLIYFESESDYKLDAIKEIFHSNLIKRNISTKSLDYQTKQSGSGERVKQQATLQQGIAQDKSKQIVKAIKDLNLKVQAQITGDSLRITGKKRDDLQTVIQHLKSKDFDCAMTFKNFK